MAKKPSLSEALNTAGKTEEQSVKRTIPKESAPKTSGSSRAGKNSSLDTLTPMFTANLSSYPSVQTPASRTYWQKHSMTYSKNIK